MQVARQLHAGTLLVPDDAIKQAQHHLWAVTRLTVEAGGATALAAALTSTWEPPGPVVVLSGVNVSAPPQLGQA